MIHSYTATKTIFSDHNFVEVTTNMQGHSKNLTNTGQEIKHSLKSMNFFGNQADWISLRRELSEVGCANMYQWPAQQQTC